LQERLELTRVEHIIELQPLPCLQMLE
jgi:hypothetical protein